MKTILVPLDGSPLAERALPYAIALARAADGRLNLIRAVPAPIRRSLEDQLQARPAEDAAAYLRALADRLATSQLPVAIGTCEGEPIDGILREAAARHADLIAMATHGDSGLSGALVGSVAETVLRRATLPVMLIPARLPEAGYAPLGASPTILVPLDGSPFAETALAPAARMSAFGGGLVLLHALSPAEQVLPPEGMPPASIEDIAARETIARAYLRDVVARSATGGAAVRFDIRRGLPPDTIASAVREHGAALVAMATHGRTGAHRLLMGSVAEAALRRSTVPILFVRPQPGQG